MSIETITRELLDEIRLCGTPEPNIWEFMDWAVNNMEVM